MKSISTLVFLLWLAAGCTLPEKAFHGAKVASRRTEAIAIGKVPEAVAITEQLNPHARNQSVESVVVIVRRAGETPPLKEYTYPLPEIVPPLSPRPRQLLESIGLQGLARAGYRAANRQIVADVITDKALPVGRLARKDLDALFKPSHLLFLTLNHCAAIPKNYTYSDFVWGEGVTRSLGTQAQVLLSAELASADTSELVWMATASLEAPIQGTATEDQVLEIVARQLMNRVPRAGSTSTQNQTNQTR